MALIREHRIVDIRHEADIYVARELAGELSVLVGFDMYARSDIETAVSELCTNALRHAGRGRATVRLSPGGLEVSVVDEGPGFGASATSLGLGVGLDGAGRLMDDMEILSSSEGSTVTVRKAVPPSHPGSSGSPWEITAVNRLKSGSTVSGDRWWCETLDDGRLLMVVVDGLGSGRGAAEAAGLIIDTIAGMNGGSPLDQMLSRAHQAARPTRGGVALLVRIDSSTIEYCGFGDLDSRVEPSGASLLIQPGILGGDIGRLLVRSSPWDGSGRLAVWTDGITPDDKMWRSAPKRLGPEWVENMVLEYGSDRDDGLVVIAQTRDVT